MPPKVIVVGGGIAGLAAAQALRARGCEAQVLEAGERFGGRAIGGERDGFRWDSAAHALSSRDAQMADLVGAAGLAGDLLPLRPERLFQVSGADVRAIDPARTLGIARIPGVRILDALRLRRLPRLIAKFQALLDPGDPLAATRLDDRSTADFVRLYFGATALGHWAAPLLEADLLCDPAETSRLLFLLHHLTRHEAPVGVLRGGLDRLAAALAAPGDRTDTRVVSVDRVRGGFEVHATGAAGEEVIEADGVVLATPADKLIPMAGPLLSHAERGCFEEARTLPAIVLVAGLEGSFAVKASRYRFRPDERRAVASLAVEPGGTGEAPAPEGCERAVLIARADWSAEHLGAPDDAVLKTLLGSLGRVLPGSTQALRFTELLRFERALPHFPVGRYRALARLARVEADQLARGRHLVFAGDHRVAPTLEGAAQSGLDASRALAGALGL
ncbi:MAG: hypothetical protein CL910_00510 [Deltaproteobacteria bacterium]|nr:hypothetical protein [Deltaproteobacteria bacterium]